MHSIFGWASFCMNCKNCETNCANTSRWHGSPNHHWLWKLHTGLQATGIMCLSSLPPDSETLISKLILNLKRGILTTDHNNPVIFLLSPGKMLLVSVSSGLVALFLKMSERGDSWYTDSSFSSLLVKLSQVFESTLLDSILKLAVIPVAGAHFPTQFFLPVNFTFNMLWNSTPWTATPFSNDPLWLTLFVEGVNDRTIAKSAVFPIIVVSKNKRNPEFILYGWSFIETQM